MRVKKEGLLGGVTFPRDFTAAGVRCGLKEKGRDLALIFSKREATAAGVFTVNQMVAAPVTLCRQRMRGGKARAIVINSGVANACTGPQGEKDAKIMAARTAEALGVQEEEVLVASTGVIGDPLPMTKILAGIPEVAAALGPEGGTQAAEAIMTTDTVPKMSALECELPKGVVRIGGMAKGAGMIQPRLATMLAFLTTDASVPSALLQSCLKAAAQKSFNRITVDGDTSTNDSVILLANGASGYPVEDSGRAAFQEALDQVCGDLARAIVRDGEGATKFVTVRVLGAATSEGAYQVAASVANSNLVKASLFGGDPNWGRILSAVGNAGVEVRPEKIGFQIGETEIVRQGTPVVGGRDRMREALGAEDLLLTIDLGIGEASATMWTTDLSYEYVRINSAYLT